MNTQTATAKTETANKPEMSVQPKPAFYRANEEEQQNWYDWWLDFDRSGE